MIALLTSYNKSDRRLLKEKIGSTETRINTMELNKSVNNKQYCLQCTSCHSGRSTHVRFLVPAYLRLMISPHLCKYLHANTLSFFVKYLRCGKDQVGVVGEVNTNLTFIK